MNNNKESQDKILYEFSDPNGVFHRNVRVLKEVQESINCLEHQIKRSSDASDNLGRKIFWLNVVLALATVVIAGVEVLKILSGTP